MSDDKKKALKSWYFYDWANQAYALTVMTVIAPALMAALYNTATGTQSGDSFYAWVLTFSMLFVVVTAPALGVIADKMPIKKKVAKVVHCSWNYLHSAYGGSTLFWFTRISNFGIDVHNRYYWFYRW